MRTFYSPQSDPENPVVCECLPIKFIVVALQFSVIIMMLAAIFFKTGSDIIYISWITYFLITVVGFALEQKQIILVHLGGCIIGAVLPLGAFLYSLYTFFMKVYNNEHEIGDFFLPILLLVAFICYLYYIWLCHRLHQAVRYKTETLPAFDTTQGLFSFNADAYDGKERQNLIYPKL